MDKIGYELYNVSSKIVAHTLNELPTQQNVHDNTQAKDLCDTVLLKFNEFDQLFDRLTNIVSYLQQDQSEEQKMTDIERQIYAHQQDSQNSVEKLYKQYNEFVNRPWVNMESINLMYGRGGQIKMECLDNQNIVMDYKTKQQEKRHIMRKQLLNMKKPPKVDKIKLKDDKCVVKTDIYQINYDLAYDQETEAFYWKIPRTKDIQISDNGLTYLQNFLKDEKSKKDIQTALDELNKQIKLMRKQILTQTKERKKNQKLFEEKKEQLDNNSKIEEIDAKQDNSSYNLKIEYNSQQPSQYQVKSDYFSQDPTMYSKAKQEEKQPQLIKQENENNFNQPNNGSIEDKDFEEEYNYQILCNKYQIMVSYIFCYIDQKIKTLFSDQVLEILSKQNREYLQKKFGPEVVYLQKTSNTKQNLKFNSVLIRFQPQTAMLQQVLKQENQLKNKFENKITQTTIYIEHISYDHNTFYQFILSEEKVNFYRQIRSLSQKEQKETIEQIQNYKPSKLIKEKINFKYLIIQEALKNDLLPKQSFSLTPFDTIYIKSNITLSQIDSSLLKPFINLEDQNQNQVDSLFLIHKPKEIVNQFEQVENNSNSDTFSYLQVVIGDKIDLEIILQQYRVIMLQQFFISDYKLSQSLHDENSMHLESHYEQQTSNLILLIRQKRQLYEQDIREIKKNKEQNRDLTQAVFKLQSHPLIKNIIYQVLICVRVTCNGFDNRNDTDIYQIIIPYLTDKQHFLIFNSLNEDIIELDSQKEQQLDELIQDLQRKETIIQNFVNTIYIAQAVQKCIFFSQFRSISQEASKDYSSITIDCRLKGELNSDKKIEILITNNFDVNFSYYFGELPSQSRIEEIQRNVSFSLFYQSFFLYLSQNVKKCLKDIYQKYYYLSDEKTKLIRELFKLKIQSDGWYISHHQLAIRPETMSNHSNQQPNGGSNQNIQHQGNGQQNGLIHQSQPRPNQYPNNAYQNNAGPAQPNIQGNQPNSQPNPNGQHPYGHNGNLNPHQPSQPGTTVQQNGAVHSAYNSQGGSSGQRNSQPYQNQPYNGNSNYNNNNNNQVQNINQQGGGGAPQTVGNNSQHVNGALNPQYNSQLYQQGYQPNGSRPN